MDAYHVDSRRWRTGTLAQAGRGGQVALWANRTGRGYEAHQTGYDLTNAGVDFYNGDYGSSSLNLVTGGLGVTGAFGRNVDVPWRNPNDATNLVDPKRANHILHGDATGGGHKFGVTQFFNGKSKFPATWGDKKILHAASEIATNPSSRWSQQTGAVGAQFTKKGDPVKYAVDGVFEGVNVRVIVQGDEIITAFPRKP